ncbi:MAG: YdcF family protein [Pseudomonadota bacterium]
MQRRYGTLGWLLRIAALCLIALAGGFVIFANNAMRPVSAEASRADAIVVLTGARQRIASGMALLNAGRAKRMLISGVNQTVQRNDIKTLITHEAARFDCCVDLGYAALNTWGNAQETADWARNHSFASVIVVTSNYHMPRALAELTAAIPRADLIAHAVVSDPSTLSPQLSPSRLPASTSISSRSGTLSATGVALGVAACVRCA